MYKIDERYLLIRDACALVKQYEFRNSPHHALSADQRKAWAAETTAVMRELVKALGGLLPGDLDDYSVYAEWNLAMREGRRLVTFKVPPGPPFGGLKFREPEFKDDPTDPRGKDPRYLRSP